MPTQATTITASIEETGSGYPSVGGYVLLEGVALCRVVRAGAGVESRPGLADICHGFELEPAERQDEQGPPQWSAELVACPCGETGHPPEQCDPTYLAELDALPERRLPIPDEPHVLCWSCRLLARASDGPHGEYARWVATVLGQPFERGPI